MNCCIKGEKMRKLESAEIKQRLSALLKEVKETCEANNIRYFICGGTLLGAVRHGGFIPWDDDIDVIMPRPDYNRLIDLQRKGLLKNTFHCNEIDKHYKYAFGKYCEDGTLVREKSVDAGDFGLWVDIFPLDGLGDTFEEAEKTFNKAKPYANLLWATITPMRIKALFLIPPATPIFFMQKYFLNKVNSIAQKRAYETSAYVGTLSSYMKKQQILNKDILKDIVMLPFEGELYAAPVGYKTWLTQFYGENYITPPPENKRKNHDFAAYDLSEDPVSP